MPEPESFTLSYFVRKSLARFVLLVIATTLLYVDCEVRRRAGR